MKELVLLICFLESNNLFSISVETLLNSNSQCLGLPKMKLSSEDIVEMIKKLPDAKFILKFKRR